MLKKGKENVLILKRGSISRFSEREINRSTSANRAFGTEITNISHNINN